MTKTVLSPYQQQVIDNAKTHDLEYQFKISRRANPKEFRNLWELQVKTPTDKEFMVVVDADMLSTVLGKVMYVFEADRAMMRKILAWLNRRFPEQLIVTLQDYNQLREEVASTNRIAQGVIDLNNRLVIIESQIKRLNDSNGFVSLPKGIGRLER